MRRLLGALPLLAVLGAACAGIGGSAGDDGSPSVPRPSGPNDLVLRVEYCCGFVPVEYTLRDVPFFTLVGDGRVIVPGPQIEIYPGPALPNLQEVRLTDEAVDMILEEARKAGLYEDRTLEQPNNIADASTTIFTVVDGEGTRHVTKAYALSDGGFDQGLPPEDREARRRLWDFQQKLGDLRSWLPKGSVGEEHEYDFTALRVFERPAGPNDVDADLKQEPKDWPLSEPLSTFGEPSKDLPELRCGVVEGDELEVLRPEVATSNELTPWLSEGDSYKLFLRPLLPDESGC